MKTVVTYEDLDIQRIVLEDAKKHNPNKQCIVRCAERIPDVEVMIKEDSY